MFENFLDYIARTNLFNFVIFFAIWVFIFRKIKFSQKLDEAKIVVGEEINESTSKKENAKKELDKIEKSIANIEDEVSAIIEKSKKNAELVGEKILSDAQKYSENIKENSQKLVENKTLLEKNDIVKRASLASVEVAKKHIINELNNNYDLHNRLIDESVNQIDGVEL